MPLVKINTPVHYHVKKYRICKNKICQGPVSCVDGNMVFSAGMALIMKLTVYFVKSSSHVSCDCYLASCHSVYVSHSHPVASVGSLLCGEW